MAGQLRPKPGLSAPIVTSIPPTWSAEWFRQFITNWMTNLNATFGVSIYAPNGTLITPDTLVLYMQTPLDAEIERVIENSDTTGFALKAIAQTIEGEWTFQQPILGFGGGEANPSFSFSNEVTTGMYWPGPGSLAFTVLGEEQLFLTEESATFANQILGIDGTPAVPAYSFGSESTSGMYALGDGSVGVSTNGNQAFQFGASGEFGIGATPNYGTAGEWLSSGGTGAPPAWTAPAALTVADDANVTLSVGGDASTALLNAASITAGWNGTLAITRGGTGQSAAPAAFNALSPMTTAGDIIIGGTAGAGTRLAIGATNDVLTVVGGVPVWAAGGGGGFFPLEDLTDVVITLPMVGDSITWNGTDWVNTPSIGGGTVTSVGSGAGLTGGPITSSGSLAVDLTYNFPWTGTNSFSGASLRNTSGTYASVGVISGAGPVVELCNASAPTDEKLWEWYVAATGSVIFQATNDAVSAAKAALTINRTGTAVETVIIGNATDSTRLQLAGYGAGNLSTDSSGNITISGGVPNVTPDTHPATPTAYDDEFEESTLNLSQWTWHNQGSGSAPLANGSVIMTGDASGSGAVGAILEPRPSGNNTWVAKFGVYSPAPNHICGLTLAESATGDVLMLGLLNNGGTMQICTAVGTLAGLTTAPFIAAASYRYLSANSVPSAQGYWQAVITGSNIALNMSEDGLAWRNIATYAFTTYFSVGPDLIGLGTRPDSTTPPVMTVDWIRRTA